MKDHTRRHDRARVVVSGAAGFIGSHLVDRLRAGGYAFTPAFNAADNLRRVLPGLAGALRRAGHPFEICVVDDGSTDDTVVVCRELARQLAVCGRSHPRNVGVGAAFRTGFCWALSLARDEDVIVTLEADNTADLGILPLMLDRIEAGAR